jgi:hypothetical protein
MRRLFWIVLVLSSLGAIGIGANLAKAQVRTVGVSLGDLFKYTVTFDLSSTDPNVTIPPYSVSLNDTEWMSTSIIDVSNPPAPANVIVQMTTRFKNGTETTQRGTTDVESGIGNMTNWVVAADLNPNDAVYTEDIYSTWLINETIVRTYPSGTRNTNHFNTSTESNMTGFYQYYSQNFYWDKSTGIMVEMSFSQITQTSVSQTIMSGKITMSESSVWVVPEFPTWTLILLILIVLTIAIATKKYRERQFGPRYNPETQVKPQ